MAWEIDKLTRTLLIEDHGRRDGRRVYRLSPFMRVQTPTGEVYLEPLPARTATHRLMDLFTFSALEIVPPPAPSRGESGGSLGLTCMYPTSGIRASSESAS